MADELRPGGNRRWSAVVAALVVLASASGFGPSGWAPRASAHPATDHRILAVNLKGRELYEADLSAPTRTADGLPRQDWQGAPFIDELVAGGLTQAVSAEFLPDGRMLVLTKPGSVRIVEPSDSTSTQLVQLPSVSTAGERGALDVVASPTFSADKRIYVYYSHSDYTMRIDRLTVGTPTQTAASRTNIYTSPPGKTVEENPWGSHLGGSLNFGADGYLYVTIGDTATSEHSQDLTKPFGKVLRIGADGSIPSDNPFVDGAGPNADEVWAYGLRNPFRASFDPVSGNLLVGDVGGNRHDTAYEEINIATRGANYGWPRCEGPLTAPKYGVNCPEGVTGPLVYYSHDPSKPTGSNASITGGEIYRGTAFPRALHGAYLYADFGLREIRYAMLSSPTQATSDGVLQTVEGRQPTWVGVGPDGLLYYVHFDYSGANSQLRRLRPSGTTGAPPEIITASASPLTGMAPLQVTFAASAADADGTDVTYRWHFGDGASADGASPSHTYVTAGTYRAHLEVSSGGQTTRSDTITITVGSPPTASITSPVDGAHFSAGETVTVRGAAIDDRPLPADAMQWEIQFLHEQHTHPVLTSPGSEVTFTVPTDGHSFEGATGYRATLTVTDADGVATKTSIQLQPRKVLVRLDSNVPGLAVAVDGVSQSLPYDLDSLERFTHSISAPSSLCQETGWGFASWSGGRPATFSLTVPASPTTLTATYVNVGVTEACGGTPPPASSPPPASPPPPPSAPAPPALPPSAPAPPAAPPPQPPSAPAPPAPPAPVPRAPGQPAARAVGGALSRGEGVWLGFTDGGLQGVGNAPHLGDASRLPLNAPVAAIASSHDGAGYWMAGRDGGVFSFGNAAFHGSTGSMRLNQPVVSLAAHPRASGYWFVAADGGVFAFGAPFHGSAADLRLAQPIVGMAPTTTGSGYWLVAGDGGIFSYGEATFSGSMGDVRLNEPIVGMAADPDGRGYWFVGADGGVFSFDAAFHGSAAGHLPAGDRAVAIVAHRRGGYWLITARGGVIGFGPAARLNRSPS